MSTSLSRTVEQKFSNVSIVAVASALAPNDFTAKYLPDLLQIDATIGAGVIVTLPVIGTMGTYEGCRKTLRKTAGGALITITAGAGNTINGGATDVTALPAAAANTVTLQAVGTDWKFVTTSVTGI